MDNNRLGIVTSVTTIALNIIFAILKLTVGVIGRSKAMIADGIHTLSDVLTTLIVILGLKISSKEADQEHPYGHEKYESVFAKLLSIILVLTGAYIGYEAIKSLIDGNIAEPKQIAPIVAFISIVVKEIMYQYTMRTAKKIKSISMETDAWHHRSDSLSSAGTFIGILGARLGFVALDPIAGIVVSILVIKVAIDLYLKSIRELVDESASEEVIANIRQITNSTKGIRGIKRLRTRIFGNKYYVDIEIFVDSDITVKEGHDIAEKVHERLERDMEDIKHCMVHVEPYLE